MFSSEIVVLGKTKAGLMVCVGGIILADGRHIRLRNPRFPFWEEDEFEIGERCRIEFEPSTNTDNPHHTEDIIVYSCEKLDAISVDTIIKILNTFNLVITSEDPCQVFKYEGKEPPLQLESRKFSCSETEARRLKSSLGFWRCGETLWLDKWQNYCTNRFRIKYVGCAEPLPKLPPKTIIRLSTSNLWAPEGTSEKRTYLQVSGWFI